MEPFVREARPEDRPFIEEIARLTWEGGDYLARAFDEWLGDNFYVLELDGKVIGTAKMTLLPGKVGWLEGLRVHPDYRGRGYGRKLHNFLLELGEKLAREGKIEALEFATYFLNRESISMAQKTGFYVKAKFFAFSAKTVDFQPEEAEQIEPELSDLTLGLIPVGWRFVRRSEEELKELVEAKRGLLRAQRTPLPRSEKGDDFHAPRRWLSHAQGSAPGNGLGRPREGTGGVRRNAPERC